MATQPEVGQKIVILPCECEEQFYVENLGEVKTKPLYAFLKRAFDIVFATVFALVLAVPMLVIALLVKCSSKGTVLYYQERLGLNGKKFNVIKFRSMRMDAEEDGMRWSMGDDDPRITPFGRFLRQTRLDELPQFWCILKGDMSVVGPRPEREAYYERDGGDFRVTFDDHILCRTDDLSLTSEAYGTPILEPGKVLMELKCAGGIPLWMAHVLSENKIYKTSFSKYGTAYTQLIYPTLRELK